MKRTFEDIPCPCGSTLSVYNCCLPKKRASVKSIDIHPPLPITGTSNAKCYFKATNDCSKEISKEHYLSKGVLEEIDNLISVEGVPWLKNSLRQSFSSSNLSAKILCKRHNNAFSPLDREGKRFVSTVKTFSKVNYNGQEKLSVFNGRDIERWMLKTLYGCLSGKILRVRSGQKLKVDISYRCVDLMYDRVPEKKGRGLFVRSGGHPTVTKGMISISPVVHPIKSTINGITFNIMGFDFLLSTSPINVEDSIYRPSSMVFSSPTGSKVIFFIWPESEFNGKQIVHFFSK